METSAPKRRKTSPTTSVPIDASNELSSADSATRRSSRFNRPSFASPTKASLARTNPDILQRRASSRSHQQKDELPGRKSTSALSQASLASALGSQPGDHDIEEGEHGARDPVEGKGVLIDDTTVEQQASPARRAGGGLSLKPRTTPSRPSPRPLPPPSAEEEELIDPFKGRRLRRSPPPGVLPQVEPEEPELPPTPTQKGLMDSSSVIGSPTGIHNTPSKRPRRSKVLAAKMTSSPLKQPPLRPPEHATELGQGAGPSRLKKEPLKGEPRRKRNSQRSHPARQVEEVDPLTDRKALRDSLLAEVAQLEEDLEVASGENQRLYESQKLYHVTDVPSAGARGRLLDVLARHALPPDKDTSFKPLRDWLEAAMNPVVFLPFGQASEVPLPPFATESRRVTEEAERPPLMSHHPIQMTADEEVPYLRTFTPLVLRSLVATVRHGDGQTQEPLLQRHEISITSSPTGLFAATIDMVVNTKTLSITKLAVPLLEPSAVGEVGPFVQQVTRGGPDCALTRNISILTWAMGEWVRLASRRAQFWYAVEQELLRSKGLAHCATTMRKITRKRPGRAHGQSYRERDENNELLGAGKGSTRPSKADLIALMGQTSLDLDLSSAAGAETQDESDILVTRIEWRIEFDWAGEARSKIGLLLRAPTNGPWFISLAFLPVIWRANDTKGSLAGLPALFDKLVRENKDPLQAAKVIVALLVGDM
ncbi:hypothetical protein GGS20DRAFT_296089 [Poronia punctata]|nr:hypothetical protein GGS20DRAFT_296089 [Poronia punctata]